MTVVTLLYLAFAAAALPPLPSDTPPPPPVPIEALASLRSMQEVIAVTLLEDGSRAPAQLVLPELDNHRQTLDYMRVHYPDALRNATAKGAAIAWLFVDDRGQVRDVRLLSTSGYPALDSLSLSVLQIAHFKPALSSGRPVGVWMPFPATIPPYDEVVTTLERSGRDISEVPVEVAYTRKPVLLNRNQIEAAIIRIIHQVNPKVREMNEAFARAQMVGGTAELDVFIDAQGAVQNAIVQKSSGNRDLDGHALQIARLMRFSPALNGEEPVAVWIQVPIRFVAGDR